VKVREVELPDEKAAVAFILQIQRQRRNLTREAMSYNADEELVALGSGAAEKAVSRHNGCCHTNPCGRNGLWLG